MLIVLLLAACEKTAPTAKALPQKEPERPVREWHAATGAIDGDCGHSGKNPNGTFQFMAPCPTSFASPDGRWSLSMGEETDQGAPVTLLKGDGSKFASIPQLSDDMPFQVLWSPRPNWFLVSHHVGSFMDRPEVYEITEHGVVSHDEFRRQGLRLAQRHFPCLPQQRGDWANGVTIGLSRDGRRLAWVFVTRTDMCSEEWGGKTVPIDRNWKNILMISDVVTGEIVPGSVHLIESLDKIELPRDAMYAEFTDTVF